MKNPWLKILYSDYENHMTEVGQTEVLNKLTKYCLNKYSPNSFALLGCSTGNGLEHVDPQITQRVYAIDINPVFLNKTREKFQNKIRNLEILNLDIKNEELAIKNVDLFFVGLVLEYVEPEKALRKIIDTLSGAGILFIVIQKNNQTSFVSRTKYKSLEKLADIANEVNEGGINKFIHSENMELIRREEIQLTESKSFITLEYLKKNIDRTNTR